MTPTLPGYFRARQLLAIDPGDHPCEAVLNVAAKLIVGSELGHGRELRSEEAAEEVLPDGGPGEAPSADHDFPVDPGPPPTAPSVKPSVE
jgi:hypothetical protein